MRKVCISAKAIDKPAGFDFIFGITSTMPELPTFKAH
jgi:hypothetical protein